MSNHYDFSDIAPFDDSQFNAKINQLVDEPGFEHAFSYVMPDANFSEFKETLRGIPDQDTFQHKVMYPFLKLLEKKTTTAITCGGIENFEPGKNYTIMSNHRDIVLDASFMNLCLLENGISTSEIAIGSNLLIFDWITDLVKLNKSFIVKRNIERFKALEAARQLSAYIHYAVGEKHENVWIAQREGRAKDSNDKTQESLIKMLALEGESGSFLGNLAEINVLPLSISYEYDPNDFLKAREFLLRRLDPEFKKSPGDDLLSMETGLLQSKGHVHFEFGQCINSQIDSIPADMPKVESVKEICRMIDCSIHGGYRIYPINYIAFDKAHHTRQFVEKYTPAQVSDFENYVESQLDKVDLTDVSSLDREYMREMMYAMYANPLRNKISAGKHC